MIVIKGPHLNETLVVALARRVFRVDPLAVITFEDRDKVITIKCEDRKKMEILNALDLVPRSLLPQEREGLHVRVLG
ncbi:MAG: hypothetical protein KatS3mg101_0170 [Patescibacteria group bacterium]|nr:MAG: hypothetical protein KatS3mg101_0170 [Patescibacteria group bacterium]